MVEGGMILGAIVGHPAVFGNISNLPYLFFFQTIFSFIFLLFYPFLSNTPISVIIDLSQKNYLIKKQIDFEVLKKFRCGNDDEIQEELLEIKSKKLFSSKFQKRVSKINLKIFFFNSNFLNLLKLKLS